MHVQQIEEISEYVRYLRESEYELDILFKELLIGVTNFFRDPKAFEALQANAIPEMVANPADEQSIRVWIPGCSTGEEAYSIAIVLRETMEQLNVHRNIQIFATDIDESSIEIARGGQYPANIASDVNPQRLKRFFTKENSSFRIIRHIREMVVFAPQDVIKDPPFTKLDMLCCRNLLIYLGSELQKRILPIFHYSIKPKGILFLGTSETIGQYNDLFKPIEKKWRIFRCYPLPSSTHTHSAIDFHGVSPIYSSDQPDALPRLKETEDISAFKLVDTVLQQSNTPPCVIINNSGDIIFIHGRTGNYLEPAQGKISTNILEMSRPGLKTILSKAIRYVSKDKQILFHNRVKVEKNGGYIFVNITVKPLIDQPEMRGMMIIIFQEVEEENKIGKQDSVHKEREKKKPDERITQLEDELRNTRENLQTSIEELETSNEELKSTNEELQSTNEELETSKEELQSLNEESSIVNIELQNRIDELSQANDDMKNLLDSTNIATIFLDMNLNIRRFTPRAVGIVPLTPADIGRPIANLAMNIEKQNILEQSKNVIDNLNKFETTVMTRNGDCFLLRILPYRTTANVIDGVVITFVDISELERIADTLAKPQYSRKRLSTEHLNHIIEFVSEPIIIIENCSSVISANQPFYSFFNLKPQEVIGNNFFAIFKNGWDFSPLRPFLIDEYPIKGDAISLEIVSSRNKSREPLKLNVKKLRLDKYIQSAILLSFNK
jgi:two-component system CheB/CheR fusion protein